MDGKGEMEEQQKTKCLSGVEKITQWYQERQERRTLASTLPKKTKHTYNYNGVELKRGCELPYSDKHEMRRIKDTMKAVKGPYPRFKACYKLVEIIDMYMQIWYADSSDSDGQ